MNNGENAVIELDRIADSVEALRDPDAGRFELNWRIWRVMMLRRLRVRRHWLARSPFNSVELNYIDHKIEGVEILYEERHNCFRTEVS
jgi:hypothetical protein